jgi:hypothetical protein
MATRIDMDRMRGVLAWLAVVPILALCFVGMEHASAAAPPGRFTVNGDDTVTDTKTGLTWQRTVSATIYSWDDAKAHCSQDGGRLPTIRELESLVDYRRSNPSIDPDAFPGASGEPFWSASPRAVDTSQAWFVHFNYGDANCGSISNGYWVRCVR